jgi:hypothetical protein
MKIIQCDRCGKQQSTISANSVPPALTYSDNPRFHYIAKLYRLNHYGNTREVDLCFACQELANEVVSRFMLATLVEETNE